ncbi:MAG: hypothetical protein EMLJLAPB_00696 [Candidatus Argoarchaeum ethanivorans]|uniref:Uncharacterized protein n=1 Tax=Candidatus Argoarchaeum ethanivorans TaxID=2608793 RepID=A0A811TF23_9EURY|nr:MAG: hypothetical protein EMLJLAPB_00696 [Candidatus Argoarchaeum ethanivorans]
MAIFTKNEKEILKKFENGYEVSEGDKDVLDRYAGIGFVQFGFNWDKMVETAKITKSCIIHLDR